MSLFKVKWPDNKWDDYYEFDTFFELSNFLLSQYRGDPDSVVKVAAYVYHPYKNSPISPIDEVIEAVH